MSRQASDIITPKALLLDERLTPLERNAWLTFRALASSDGTVILSYDALRQYRGQMCQPASGNCHRISNGFSPHVSGACLRNSAWRYWPSGMCAANQVECTTPSPTSTG